MRIFPPEVEVGDYEGFTPEKDIFRRKEFGESLRSLLEMLKTQWLQFSMSRGVLANLHL